MKRTQKTFSQQTSHTGILAQLLRSADAFGKTNQPPASLLMSFDAPFLPLLLSLLEKNVGRQKGTPLCRQCLLPFLEASAQIMVSSGWYCSQCLGVDCDVTLGRLKTREGTELGEEVNTGLQRGCSLTKTWGNHLQHHNPFEGGVVHLIYVP